MLASQRALFDIPRGLAYLNNASYSPLPHAVRVAGDAGVAAKSAPWAMDPDAITDQAERVRNAAASFIGAAAEDIAITPSVAYGVATAAANLPLPPGSGSAAFRSGWQETILPALDRFAPDLLVVSAGFDAHRDDPLAQLQLEADDFAWVTTALMQVADRHCGGRIVSILEGGYDLAALAESTAAHVRALMRAPRFDPSTR